MKQIYVSMILLAFCFPHFLFSQNNSYSPLETPPDSQIPTLDLVVKDTWRERHIPVLIYLPAEKSPVPVVLFSHGLGGSRFGCSYLGEHWAARGYVAVFIQHPGSDVDVWKDKPIFQRRRALKRAASARNFLLRVRDIPVVIDQLERWNSNHDTLKGRMDLSQIGMSGHSFGAVTTQAVSGQTAGRRHLALFTDDRIQAAIAFSPSSPRRGTPKEAFSKVQIPWMLMTGTKDTASIGNTDMQSRLAVFPALPPGDKYELVLYKAEHSAFTERALPGDTEKRNPNHHKVILALSTAFWDTYLQDDLAAEVWLKGKGPRSVMEQKDRWQMK